MANIPGYKGDTGVVFQRDEGDKRWLYVYNGTASAVTNGDVYQVSYVDDATGVFPKLLAIASDAVAHCIIGVVENSAEDKATIAAAEWGWVQVRGYCIKVTTGASVTDEHTVEAKANAAGVASTEAGSAVTANSFAINKGTITGASNGPMYLLGRENVVIAAS
jgi:hypothetical protein